MHRTKEVRHLAEPLLFAAYATLEIEYPRRGLIRLTNRNHALLDVRNSMK